MRLLLVDGPALEPITLVEARQQCRVDATGSPAASPLDTQLQRYIGAAVAHLDGPFGYLGRALVTQTWDLKLDFFPDEIEIPLPPLQDIESVKYIDANGDEQTVSPSVYRVVEDTRRRARLVENYNEVWPETRAQPDAVTIRFTAGWQHEQSPLENPVPESIRNALLLMVEDFFDGKTTRKEAWQALLASFRVYE